MVKGKGYISRFILKFAGLSQIFVNGLQHVRFRGEIGGMVGAADQRPGRHVPEALGSRDLLITDEVVRMDVFDHRQVVAGGAQVLPQRQHRDAVFQQVVHGPEKLVLPSLPGPA